MIIVPSWQDDRHQVHLQTWCITDSVCILEFTLSWYAEMRELEGGQHIMNSLLNLVRHPKWIFYTQLFWLNDWQKRVGRYVVILGYNEQHEFRRYINPWQLCVRNFTNCMDLDKLTKSVWEQNLGKIRCVLCIMKCLSTLRSTRYTLPVAESISVIMHLCIYISRLR